MTDVLSRGRKKVSVSRRRQAREVIFRKQGDSLKYFFGVDLGGTNIKVGLVDQRMRIVAGTSIRTGIPRSPESICRDIWAVCRKLAKEQNVSASDTAWIGVGAPGLIDHGIIAYANNLQFDQVPFEQILAEIAGRPAFLENDANTAALGELMAGAGKGCDSLVMITLGTGVGGGIILNRTIYHGMNGAAGEIGHMTLEVKGRRCTCGLKGCFESYCSATALTAITKEAMRTQPDSILWKLCDGDLNQVSAKTAFQGKKLGDPLSNEIVSEFLCYLSTGVANIIQLLQPQVICIGGGVSSEGDEILIPLRKQVRSRIHIDQEKKQTKITAAKLGNDAGIIGAAMLGIDRADKK